MNRYVSDFHYSSKIVEEKFLIREVMMPFASKPSTWPLKDQFFSVIIISQEYTHHPQYTGVYSEIHLKLLKLH